MKRDKEKTSQFEAFPAGRPIQGLLAGVLQKVNGARSKRVYEIDQVWPKIIGEKFIRYTKVGKFDRGVLYITVTSAVMLSLLVQQEKENILNMLKEELPHLGLQDIVFQRG